MENMDKYLGKTLDDRYEILDMIGTGGMAVVYKALDHRLGRKVAVKILRDELYGDAEFRARFQTEAQAVAMLSHPNIVSVYDVSRKGEVEYIVMELIDGITLKQYMLKKGALGWKEALHFAVQITKALEHAHEKGIVHRDIKPQNIMILRDGTIKVADFGIAALESASEALSEETIGSVHYMSPEQARGESPDATCDIYSLGVVLYEMLTGCLPFEGSTAEEIALKHISGNPVKPREIKSDIPEDLEKITLHAMKANKESRYQSAALLLADLEMFQKIQAVAKVLTPAFENGGAADKRTKEVKPLLRTSEMTEEEYQRRRQRSRKVSLLTGVFGVLIFLIAIFIFLWNFWLKDLFRVADRIEMPNFIGESYESVASDKQYDDIFTYTVYYDFQPDMAEGIIIEQDPEPQRSMMIVPEGINVSLTVSTGYKSVTMPDVVNWQYQEAYLELRNAGLEVEQTVVASDTVTEGYVIKTNPSPGEQITTNSTVFVTVSGGPDIVTVEVPNLIGMDEADAIAKIEAAGLTLATTTRVESDYDEGVVFKQSIAAYSEVEEKAKIFIWVSTGPKETPTPPPTVTAAPPPPQTEESLPPEAVT